MQNVGKRKNQFHFGVGLLQVAHGSCPQGCQVVLFKLVLIRKWLALRNHKTVHLSYYSKQRATMGLPWRPPEHLLSLHRGLCPLFSEARARGKLTGRQEMSPVAPCHRSISNTPLLLPSENNCFPFAASLRPSRCGSFEGLTRRR